MVEKLQRWLLVGVAFLFPLFFLTITQEYYLTNKIFLLTFVCLLLLIISAITTIVRKKVTLYVSPISLGLMCFITAVILSIVISSPNKMQALLTPSYGFIVWATLVAYYFNIVLHNNGRDILQVLSYSALVAAVLRILFFLNPFGSIASTSIFGFLKPNDFTPLGTQLEATFFFGFFCIYFFGELFTDLVQKSQRMNHTHILKQLMLLTIFIAMILSVYTVVQVKTSSSTEAASAQTNAFAPWTTSVSAALQTFKKPEHALFGVGVDNFTTAFAQAKTSTYNTSKYWAVPFDRSRNVPLHIWTEMGLVGLVAYIAMIGCALYYAITKKTGLPYVCYCIAIGLLFPPSLITFFLFFTTIALFVHEPHQQIQVRSYGVPYYFGIIGLLVAGVCLFYVGRLYLAETYFKTSLNFILQNDGRGAYNAQKKAITYAPYVERFRTSFSQVNLLIANSVVTSKNQKLSKKDQAQLTQSIQQAISEAKSALSLNDKRASNWANLGFIYRNIIPIVKGSDAWAISSYQRAIDADPQNPTYRLTQGGVYYSIGQFKQAETLFQQVIALRPTWANAHYNLAWVLHDTKQDEKALAQLDIVLQLIPSDSPDYKKVSDDRALFEKNMKEEVNKINEQKEQPSNTLPQLTVPN